MSRFLGLSIGIYEKALPSNITWAERLVLAAEAGFDFVEMSLDPSMERLGRLEWSPAQRRELRRAIESADMPIRTLCLSAHREYPLGCADASIRERGLTILRQTIDLAVDLGIRIVQVAGYDTLPDERPDEHSRRRYEDALWQGTAWAGARGVLLGLENQEAGYIDSPTTAVSLIQKVNSPYLQLYMDIGNLVVNRRDVRAEVAAARGHLVGIHVKDARPGVPRRVPFGEGDVPFAAAFRQLAEMGFCGPVMIEMWNDDRDDSAAVCAAARAWVENRLLEAGFPTA
ncbi:MAG: L-ribulose-5-phosphate 3-epimerase [Chloroflexi bacterium]|nr:L-ribulose-5-phosphate 3-epimerase [Chloroflexota bacterium]MDL1884093.1 L-ribulose-5-phosphate 3-epimerase [Anaerolineae bacterium CFX8]